MSVRIAISEAKAQLTELVRQAEAGEDVILTRFGKDAVRLAPVARLSSRNERRAIIEAVRASARVRAAAETTAERSQDFLYDDDGLPA